MSAENTKQDVKAGEVNEMPAEYDLDHSRAQPNRFASRVPQGRVVGIVLDPDVAEVFGSSEAVNRFLRAAIESMPPRDSGGKRPAPSGGA